MPEILITSFRVSYHRCIEAQSIQKLVTRTTVQVQHAAWILKTAYSLDTRHKNTEVPSTNYSKTYTVPDAIGMFN